MVKTLIATLAAAVLAGCATGAGYQRPVEELPAQWSAGLQQAQVPRQAWAQWWTRYQDPVLNQLVEAALADNLDAGIAATRIAEARALLGLAEAERYPTLSRGARPAGPGRGRALSHAERPGRCQPGRAQRRPAGRQRRAHQPQRGRHAEL